QDRDRVAESVEIVVDRLAGGDRDRVARTNVRRRGGRGEGNDERQGEDRRERCAQALHVGQTRTRSSSAEIRCRPESSCSRGIPKPIRRYPSSKKCSPGT